MTGPSLSGHAGSSLEQRASARQAPESVRNPAGSIAWLLGGTVGGLFAVGVDLLWAAGRLGPMQMTLPSSLAMGAGVGMLFGALCAALSLVRNRLEQRGSERGLQGGGEVHWVWWPLASLPWLPLGWVLAQGSLTGHKVRQIADPAWSVPLASFVLASGAGAALVLGAWLFGRVAGRRMDSMWRWMGTAALVGLAVSLSGLNARLYVRLYPEIHAAMSVASFSALFLAAALAFADSKAKRSAGVWVVLAGLVAGPVLARLGMEPLRRSQMVRRAVYSLPSTGLILAVAVRRSDSGLGRAAAGPSGNVDDQAGAVGTGPIDLRGASVLLITIDALRADRVGCYHMRRAETLTPNLDRFCTQAVVFHRTYCHAPHSSFSLSSLQTGMPMRSLVALGEPLPRTLADILSERGYRTEAFCTNGIFFTEGEKLRKYQRRGFGFDHLDPNGYDGKELTDKAIAALDRLSAGSKPFYLWVHYFDVHEPYRVHPGITKGKRSVDRYDGEVKYADMQVARLLRHAAGLHRPAVVVLTADHGEEFGEHGGSYHGSSLYEEQVRVPLLWWLPGVSPKKVTEPVSLIDVVPTILDLLKIPYQGSLEGKSLTGLAAGRGGSRGPVFAEVSTKKMVRDGRYKLIFDQWRSLLELYDLSGDPSEKQNLADTRPRLVARLRSLLARHAAHLSRRLAGLPRALALARLGDPKAKDGLCRLALDAKADRDHRFEAIKRLAKMPGGCTVPSLCSLLVRPGPGIRREAAVALGELESACGRAELRALLSEAVSARLRHRAAVAAGRLGLAEAQPYLIEALADPDPVIRYRAGHYLGRIGDSRAVAALMAATSDRPAAHLVAFALGRIGARSGGQVSAKVGRFLGQWMGKAHSMLVKRYILKAMGLLARPEHAKAAFLFLGRAAVKEAEETLVRCHGLGTVAFGVDFSPSLTSSKEQDRGMRRKGLPPVDILPRAEGLQHCAARKPLDFRYLHATTCRSGGRVKLLFEGPSDLSGPWRMSLRGRIVSQGKTGKGVIHLWVNGADMGAKALGPGWQDLVWQTPGSFPVRGSEGDPHGVSGAGFPVEVLIQADPGSLALELDHFLMYRSIPRR